jgi:hypothetical protein
MATGLTAAAAENNFYLRITGLPVGMILHFQRAKLAWKRISL